MKKFIYLLTLMVLTGFGAISQGAIVTVSGTVTSITTGLPVPNQVVSILSLDSTMSFSYDFITNASGYYAGTFTIPGGMIIPQLVVSTFSNCAPGDVYTQIITPTPMGNIVNFSVCTATVNNCSAAFVIMPNLPPVPDIFFADASTGNVINWYWEFGDGTSSTQQNPSHAFSAPGFYEVCLTIFTSDSCIDSYCEWLPYNALNCQAEYGYVTNVPGTPPLGVTFQDFSLGNVIDWTWSFGDGTTSSAQNPYHQYSATGVYTVCLDIFTSDSCTSTFCDSIFVDTISFPPTCEAYFYTGGSSGAGALAFFDASWATSPIMSWYWEFGDGSVSYDQNPTHTYNALGLYTVCLTTVTLDTCISSYCEDVYYGGGSTLCSAGYYYIPGASGSIYDFDFVDMSMGSVIEWNWDFGDGTTSSLQNPFHTFPYMGAFEVCLSIFTADSCSSSYCEYVYVDSMINPPMCDAYFYYGSNPGMLGLGFNDLSYSASPIIAWDWTFGDGTSSTLQNPAHMYNAFGWYTVCLTITTMDSCSSTYCEDVFYGGGSTLCSAGFYYSQAPSGTIYDFAFTDLSQGSVVEWNWNFGDGTTSNVQNPYHTFSTVGLYEVCLSILTSDSCSSMWCEYVYVDSMINPPGCEAYFAYDIGIFANSTFYDFSSASSPIISWYWTFGDGTSSYDQNPTHPYNAIGWYNACLTIMTLDSCTSTYCEDIYYAGAGGTCEAFFAALQSPISNPLEVSFIDNSFGNVIYWTWSFGDGTASTDQNPVHLYSAPGLYEVCLSIFTSDSCSSTYCEYVDVMNTTLLYDVSGAVLAGVDSVNNGIAMLMGNNGSIFVEDIAFGSYLFTGIPAGTYILYAIPSYIDYPTYAPTYHDTALFWTDATEIIVASNVSSVDVYLQDLSSTTVGPCIISGSILWNTTLTTNTYKDRVDNSVGDISLLLFDMNDNLLEFTPTNETGYFEFAELPYGTYKLYVELTGHVSYPAIITLDEGNSVVNDIIINIAEGTIVFDVEEIESGNVRNINLYPNPVNDKLNIEFDMESNSYLDISILNAFGQEVLYFNESLTIGKQQLSIDVADLASGIYFISLKEDNTNKVLKFIK